VRRAVGHQGEQAFAAAARGKPRGTDQPRPTGGEALEQGFRWSRVPAPWRTRLWMAGRVPSLWPRARRRSSAWTSRRRGQAGCLPRPELRLLGPGRSCGLVAFGWIELLEWPRRQGKGRANGRRCPHPRRRWVGREKELLGPEPLPPRSAPPPRSCSRNDLAGVSGASPRGSGPRGAEGADAPPTQSPGSGAIHSRGGSDKARSVPGRHRRCGNSSTTR